MPGFSLDDVKEAVDAKYGPCEINLGPGIEPVVLLPTARLGDDKLEQMKGMVDDFNRLQATAREMQESSANEDDPEEAKRMIDLAKAQRQEAVAALENALRIPARSEADADRLIEACEHDMLYLSSVFAEYQKTGQVGEASASPDSSENTAGHSPTTSSTTTD